MQEHYDVLVIGGGAAAVGATQRNVLKYCGLFTQSNLSRAAVGGVGAQVLAELRKLNAVEGPLRLPTPSNHVIAVLDPEGVKLALDRVVTRAEVSILLHTMLIAASRNGDRITAVTLQDDRGPREISADTFIDASGEGDLAAFGGASVRYGNHETAQAGTLGVRFGGIAPEADRSAARWESAVKQAKAEGVPLLDKEKSPVLTLPISGDVITYYIDATYVALDSASITGAERAGREKAWAYLAAAQKIPGYEKAFVASTGPKFGTRESRHINAHYQITENDVTGGIRHDDVVALGAWSMEYHSGRRQAHRVEEHQEQGQERDSFIYLLVVLPHPRSSAAISS